MIKHYSLSIAKTILVVSLLSTPSIAQQVAPVYPPAGGFHIEGNLRANTPTANVGDWLTGPGGTGGFVMTDSGVPLDTVNTFHFVDLWNSSSDEVISGQANDNPNTSWSWGLGNAPAKTDLNNVLIHFTKDSIGCNKWLMFAADRESSTGTNYVDFEFLQNTLTTNTNGTFTSAGPHDGRTTDDLMFTVELTNGGSPSTIQFYKWDTITPGVYDYVMFVPPAGLSYGFTSAGGEPVPYGAFGQTTYLSNQFVEGMVDLDGVIQSYFTSLDTIVFKTLTVKTKTSASLSAQLSDMIAPKQLNNLTIDCLVTGIEKAGTQNAFQIMPNPSNGKFTITYNGSINGLVEIYNIIGERVYQSTINNSASIINLSAAAGVYFVKVTNGQKLFTQKLVIE
jgi:hypothetical protein